MIEVDNSRIKWVDNAKYILILCVILLHLFNLPSSVEIFIGSFTVPGFFFCAGYVYKHKCSLKIFLYNKFRSLFIPWLFFSNFNILLSHIFSFNIQDKLSVSLIKNMLQIREYGDGLWFISALFIAFIPFYFVINSFKLKYIKEHKYRKYMPLFLSIVLLIVSLVYSCFMNPTFFPWNNVNLPWHIEYIFIAVFFMVTGYYYRNYFESKLSLDRFLSFIIVLFIYIIALAFKYMLLKNTFFVACFDKLTAVIGTMMIVNVSKMMKSNKYTSFIGQNTITYFAIHGKAISLLQNIIIKFFGNIYYNIINNYFLCLIFLVILTFITATVLIYPTIIIKKCLPFLYYNNQSKNRNT